MKFKMRKTVIIGSVLIFVLAFSAGATAASTLEKIQANLNHGITFLLDGKAWTPKDDNGKKLAPISYKGTTYVPLRAVAEVTGVDVEWNGAKQQISLNQDVEKVTTRRPFSSDTVASIKSWDYSSNGGITRNKGDLLFGETQYTEAFIVNEVNSASKGVFFSVSKGTSKVGVLIGYQLPEDDQAEGKYSIVDREGSVLATGKLKSGTVVDNIVELPKGVTELQLKFTGPAGSKGTGYLIWDESWIE